MNEKALRHDLFLLLGFLLTSAHGLYEEPRSYGPFRLLDAARRLTTLMDAQGLGDSFLERLRASLESACTGTAGDEELRGLLDELVVQYAGELKARLDGTGGAAPR